MSDRTEHMPEFPGREAGPAAVVPTLLEFLDHLLREHPPQPSSFEAPCLALPERLYRVGDGSAIRVWCAARDVRIQREFSPLVLFRINGHDHIVHIGRRRPVPDRGAPSIQLWVRSGSYSHSHDISAQTYAAAVDPGLVLKNSVDNLLSAVPTLPETPRRFVEVTEAQRAAHPGGSCETHPAWLFRGIGTLHVEHLSGPGKAAAAVVLEAATTYMKERPGTGGCNAFHNPLALYDHDADCMTGGPSVLVVFHDGGDFAPFFNENYECHVQLTTMREALAKHGLYAHRTTSYSTEILPIT